MARFVVRGTYNSLTTLDAQGGTLVDASRLDGSDLLMEYLPGGDRSSIEAAEGEGWAELRLPGVNYRLVADADVLEVGAAGGVLVPGTGKSWAGTSVRSGTSWMGVEGSGTTEGGFVDVTGGERIALSRESRWPDGEWVQVQADADYVRVEVDGETVDRASLVEGAVELWTPAGAVLTGERSGCDYDGLTLLACGGVTVRCEDDARRDIPCAVSDGDSSWTLPAGGGRAEVGTEARTLWLWAGPRHGAAEFSFGGGEESFGAVLARVSDDELADFDRQVLPDRDASRWSWDDAHAATGQGIDYVVALADDFVPSVDIYRHDDVFVEVGSRAGGNAWAWPFSASGRRAGNGAVPAGFGALDTLSLLEGATSSQRILAVTTEWVAAARAETHPRDWDPLPEALVLESLDDLPVLTALLDDFVDVVPIGERTWIETRGARNAAAIERGLHEGRVSAGNGPRVRIERAGDEYLRVSLTAPGWMGVESVAVHTSGTARAVSLRDGQAWVRVEDDADWVLVTASGARERPWGGDAAWAVSAPVWLGGP